LDAYRSPSPVALAAGQLAAVGKSVRPGQQVRFLHTLGAPGVYAWDLPSAPNPRSLDLKRYARLLLRAASTVLQPLGVSPEVLHAWLFSRAGYGAPPGQLPAPPRGQQPLWHRICAPS
jgi:hypothetical protein